ncbi:MAG: hypothetical protein HYZ85_04575 [Candidatus Omnitrophica bacterium]|nr:hypothetical protein [Candidatus Omnitrophota bacterium]
MRKQITSILGALLITALLVCLAWALFSPWFLGLNEKRAQKSQILSSYKSLLLQNESLQMEWDKHKASLIEPSQTENIMNLWTQDLLNYSSSESLVFSKLEPQGIQEKKGKKEAWLYLEFQGDIQKLVRFLYHLMEKDPAARLEGLSLKKPEGEKLFHYEIILAKPIQGGL